MKNGFWLIRAPMGGYSLPPPVCNLLNLNFTGSSHFKGLRLEVKGKRFKFSSRRLSVTGSVR